MTILSRLFSDAVNCQANMTSDKWMDDYRALVEWYLLGEAEVLRKTSTPVPICLPQVQKELVRDWTQTFILRGQWLTAWTMVWPHGNIDCLECIGQKRNAYRFWWETLNERDHLKDSNKEENYKNVYFTEYSHMTQLGY